MKTGIRLLAAAVALSAVASVAQAETRFAVQDAAGTTDKMVVTDSGSIGVGVAVPTAGVHIKSGVYPYNIFKAEGNETSSGAGFIAYHIKSNGTLPVAGDRLGYMLFGSAKSDGTPLHSSGLSAKADGPWTDVNIPTAFILETTGPSGLARLERMRISSNGNIGIGNYSAVAPSQKLEVDGGLRLSTSTAKPASCGASTRGTIWFSKGTTGVADKLEVCAKDASENYAWRALY